VAAKNYYASGGAVAQPMVIRAYMGRGWGAGPQHSQALHAFFMHVPGIKVVAPATPYDAKGCLIESIRDNNPVLFVEHRLLARLRSHVPEEPYTCRLGVARVVREGSHITIIGISYMAVEALRAAGYLEEVGIDAEVVDPVSLSPLDMDTISASVRKTGRLLVVDNGWLTCGATAEIAIRAVEAAQGSYPVAIRRMGFAAVTCPTTPGLEDAFYPNAQTISSAAFEMVNGPGETWAPASKGAVEAAEFRGPF